ncbi:MAG TPA: T9SS type A sorting domain-containing protein [Chitinophagales bacterium]|nr:T9SS type A sorting domain-containing protein [Chitinophagales bacterium]
MKKILFFIFFCCAGKCDVCVAQAGEWTWVRGDNSIFGNGLWGTIPAPDNTPPPLYSTVTWIDQDNNFWLFGGNRTLFGDYADLWKFDPVITMWTFEKGFVNPNQPEILGNIGIPSPGNRPGSTSWGEPTWVSNNNDLWYYCDSYTDLCSLTELWRFNIPTKEWTCMDTFSATPHYGQLQIPSQLNSPGARTEVTASWTDNEGNFWFFGGQASFCLGGSYADMWKYDIDMNQWQWMSGDTTYGFSILPVYGIKGVFNPANTPGQTNAYCHWKDFDGKFYLFGGGNPYVNIYSTLWEYDPIINQWAWISGDTIPFSTGNYTFQCDPGSLAYPPRSTENRACATDASGNFWMMAAEINSGGWAYNDLWVYIPNQSKWIWVSGNHDSTANSVYGTLGIPAAQNHPGPRYGCAGWMDSNCNFWLFGGRGDFNDLWKFTIDSSCSTFISCLAPISTSSNSLCEKFCTSFYDQSNNNPSSWQWQFPGGDPSSSTDQNPTNICYNTPGTYDVTLITTNANGSDTLTLHNYITVYPTPPFPTITQIDYTLTSSPANSYQWQLNAVDIPGATNQSYTVLQSGYYTVVVGDSNSCKNSTTTYVLISGVEDVSDKSISISPNPSNGNFMIEWLNGQMVGDASIDVVNTLGQKVFSSSNLPRGSQVSSYDFKKQIDLSNVARGIYFVEIKTENEFVRKKIVIEE